MFTSNPYRRALTIFIVAMIPFTIARIALHVIYSADFQDLTFSQIVLAYIHGLRFDAAIIILYIGFPLIFIMLPFQWAKTKIWQLLWAWVIFFMLLFFVFSLTADTIYFDIVHRHTGPEVLFILSDVPLMLDVAVSSYLGALIGFAIFCTLIAVFWTSSFKKPIDASTNKLKHGAVVFVLFLGLIIVGRGGLQLKPVRLADAFTGANPASAYLTINGTFAITQTLRSKKPESVKFMSDEEAILITQKFIKADNETFVDKNYPLMRKVTHSTPSTSPNIVFLLIESLDAIHFDRMRELNGLKPFGSTPNLDKISEQGILFTNFYATGQRSIDGIAATIASVPTLPGFPYLGQGLEQNRLSFMGNIAKSQDYATVFTRSASRGSFHVDSISSQAGFDEYYGAEDIPSAHGDLNAPSDWGVWDHDTFQFTLEKFNAMKKPFLGYLFTSTTHTPWRIPEDKWKLHEGEDNRTKYLNSLYYADWAIGQFMEQIKKQSYYDNTIFVITGDHISRFGIDTTKLTSRFHIPLIIFGAGIHPKIDPQVGNQMDILPTLINLAKWETTHSSIGTSLLGNNGKHFSFSINGGLVNHIGRLSSFSLNPQLSADSLRSEHRLHESDFTRTTAVQQTIFNALLNNRVFGGRND